MTYFTLHCLCNIKLIIAELNWNRRPVQAFLFLFPFYVDSTNTVSYIFQDMHQMLQNIKLTTTIDHTQLKMKTNAGVFTV